MYMEFVGTQSVAVSLEKTWAYLTDVHKVAACVPGFQDLRYLNPEHWQAHVSVGIGLFKVRFALDVIRPESVFQDYMTVVVRGKAPGSSFELTGRIALESLAAEQTVLHWTTKVSLFGAIARAGGRMVRATGERLIADYFFCLKERLQMSVASGF
jgi:carbon monoxide dehydrogenase subunit G